MQDIGVHRQSYAGVKPEGVKEALAFFKWQSGKVGSDEDFTFAKIMTKKFETPAVPQGEGETRFDSTYHFYENDDILALPQSEGKDKKELYSNIFRTSIKEINDIIDGIDAKSSTYDRLVKALFQFEVIAKEFGICLGEFEDKSAAEQNMVNIVQNSISHAQILVNKIREYTPQQVVDGQWVELFGKPIPEEKKTIVANRYTQEQLANLDDETIQKLLIDDSFVYESSSEGKLIHDIIENETNSIIDAAIERVPKEVIDAKHAEIREWFRQQRYDDEQARTRNTDAAIGNTSADIIVKRAIIGYTEDSRKYREFALKQSEKHAKTCFL